MDSSEVIFTPLCFIAGRKWNRVMGNERQSLWKDTWSKHFSWVLFRLSLPFQRCPQAKHQVRQSAKILRCWAENTQKPDPHKNDSMLWKRWRYILSVSVAVIGSVIGSPLAPGPGNLSSTEKGVVTVIYGCCNPCSESPDVYPTPYFLLLKRALTGNPKPEKRLAGWEEKRGRERRGGKGEGSIGLFSSTCWDLGLKGRQVKLYTAQWRCCYDTCGVVPSSGSREIRKDCYPCGFSTLLTYKELNPSIFTGCANEWSIQP